MAEGKDPGNQSLPPAADGKIGIKRGIEPDKPTGLPPEEVQDRRGRPVYLARTKWRIPPWAIAVTVFVALMAGLFLVLPVLLDRVTDEGISTSPVTSQPDQDSDFLLRQDLAVVKVASAPLLDAPDRMANRVAEALFNELVSLVDSQDRDYIRVRLQDGVEGYLRRDYLSADKSSVMTDEAVAKVVVRASTKRIMSHSSQGSLLVEAPMGSIFYADYRQGDLLRVRLPDRQSGWINSSGVMLLPPESDIPLEDNLDQLLVASMMAFYNQPLVPGGATSRGISLEGAFYVSGLLNGLSLTRDPQALMLRGQPVSLPLDSEKASDLTYLQEGDLVFFHEKTKPQTLWALAMRVADDQVLIALPGKSTLQLMDLDSAQVKDLSGQVMAARRYSD